MNDKLIMENYLLLLKSTMEVYVHGTLESSSERVRSLLKSGLDETLKHQACTYDLMSEYGWYNVDAVSIDTIKNVLSKLC